MNFRNSGIVVSWYFHLPTICPSSEVQDLAHRSIDPLLRAHERRGVPLTLAISGTLLSRLAIDAPRTVEMLSNMTSEGLCDGAVTLMHEAFPSLLSFRFLHKQISSDVAIKTQLLGVEPRTFFPPNFAWVGAIESCLAEHGIDQIILDADHYRLAVSPQSWRWSGGGVGAPESVLLDPSIDRRELWRVIECEAKFNVDSNVLRCFFRDSSFVRKFSFGSTGLIQQVNTDSEIVEFAEGLNCAVDSGFVVTLADDGDRVNPVSLRHYETFLDILAEGSLVRCDQLLSSQRFPRLSYLPGYALPNFESLLLEGMDSRHYMAILAELCALDVGHNYDKEIMELQDIFFLFWKTVSRKREYLQRALEIVKSLSSSP